MGLNISLSVNIQLQRAGISRYMVNMIVSDCVDCLKLHKLKLKGETMNKLFAKGRKYSMFPINLGEMTL